MKVSELIQELNKLDPDMDILFAKSNWASEISVGAELVNGYAVEHSQKSNPIGTRPPIFLDHKVAHRICEDGKTYLNFKSRYVKPAIYLRSVEPDFDKAMAKYKNKQTRKNLDVKLNTQSELFQ